MFRPLFQCAWQGPKWCICRTDHLVEESHHAGHSSSPPCHSVSEAMERSAQTKEMKPRASAVAFLSMARIASSCCFVGPSVQCYSVVLATLFVVYVIKPIPKNALNSTADSSNYRAISLNSIMSEIIDYIIIPLIESIFPMCIKNQPHYVHS